MFACLCRIYLHALISTNRICLMKLINNVLLKSVSLLHIANPFTTVVGYVLQEFGQSLVDARPAVLVPSTYIC